MVSVAALVQHPLMGVMSLESAGITRPADLVGTTVGYPGIPEPGGLSHHHDGQ